ncbi:hypothetical protein PHYBLDRAFT_139165 [Phycomyces blakesleeanus NRRL 1555(-)]|uniref:Uncharacterized protein n=1 Tax=Phycomyces blakesleeanus (strain ATCC 8743b / DSM 1359 / FGSC 10004 / NBRC 33097 / NRRL 1555) TaxID=763407 RepID=A0A167Q5Y9_PHYB8|nr:hypothetical protein PHYBLDRAFT_139165 [Phycomyces blakesleeanus NRRL 1555(-)]OAD79128.1 hypothetical protein PHYBLDRAFT_139165 [Phycomyces blakesleeanus NRRL 1555(-)]|eukprot:XP_018297168.1 hypothetical protein PHYBLDRAFT_139165 [Phycomyces blakesleeanus NRRL 1555(-)]
MDGSEVMHRLWNRDLAAVLNFRHILNNLRYDGTIPVRFTRVIRIGRIRRQAEDLQEGRRPTQATADCESQLIEFAKGVFLITDSRSETAYERKELATKNGAHVLKAQRSRKRLDPSRRVGRKIVYIALKILAATNVCLEGP